MRSSKIVAIIQARIGSTRLPSKAMLKISEKPMLWHVIQRLKKSQWLNEIVVATTTLPADEEIERFTKDNGFACFRGSEEDVLDRYFQTARTYRADVVVRITSDCPLIDVGVVDKVISTYLQNQAQIDVATNTRTRTYPRGLDAEVVSITALTRCWQEAVERIHREHVTKYIYEQKDGFKILHVINDKDFSSMRWTVDEEADLEFVRNIYERLYKINPYFGWKDVVALIEKEPELQRINKDVQQKVSLK